jgi:hypothetical protein
MEKENLDLKKIEMNNQEKIDKNKDSMMKMKMSIN